MQLTKTEKQLSSKTDALSVLDRYWTEMETQSSQLVERLQDGGAAPADSALSGLLQQLAAPSPLSGAELESALKQRTQRFEGLLAKVVNALAASRAEQKTLLAAVQAGSDPEAAKRATAMAEGDAARAEALSVKLQAEQASTAAQLHTARDRLTVAEQVLLRHKPPRVSPDVTRPVRPTDPPCASSHSCACCCARVLRWAGAKGA